MTGEIAVIPCYESIRIKEQNIYHNIPLNYSELQTILIALKDRREGILRNEVAVEDKQQDCLTTNNIYNKLSALNNENYVHVN